LNSETRDSAWASQQAQDIKHALGNLKHSEVHHVLCGGTLCRTTIAHHTEDNRRTFLDADILGQAPFNTSCFFTPTGSGVGTVVYCSRHGQSLPQVDAYLP